MFNFINSQIWFYPQTIDFRKQMNSLMLLICDLDMNPGSGAIYIFRSKTKDKLKILIWEKNGFWLLYRKLAKGQFRFPDKHDQSVQLTSDQLSWLLSGLDLRRLSGHPTLELDVFQ